MDKLAALKTYFGYTAFRPGQEDVIDALLAGRDALAVMPTGAGKSLCYQIPALLLEGLTVVVSPLISLMKDQVNALSEAGISAAYLNSSLSSGERAGVLRGALQGKYRIIYIAPERLLKGELQGMAETQKIPLAVIDEAHCISHWGHDFRPGYLQIAEFIRSLKIRPVTAAFTATATPRVKEDIVFALGLRAPFELSTGFDRPNLYFEVQKPADKTAALLECLETRRNKSGIVYCSTRKNVEELCGLLNRKGFAAARYHAGLEDQERRDNQDDFLYDRKTVMVATNAFGMGIDKSNVAFVIHYNMPKNIESYYQEAGRAGRDGERADCILLYSGEDVQINKYLISTGDQALIEHNLELLKQMTFYASGTDCLRSRILGYFGEAAPNYCGNCSNCNTLFETADITLEAQKIISCVYRLKQRGRSFGKTMITDILRGKGNKKTAAQGLETLSTWGIMADTDQRRVRQILDYLIDHDYLAAEGHEYPVVAAGSRSREIIFEKRPLAMMLPKEERPKARASIALELAAIESAPVSEVLLESLKELRKTFAEEAGVPAYIIFTDSSLRDMCRRLPKTAAAFMEVSGVGTVKMKKYGAAFTALIKAHAEAGKH
jgi:ATP-dependent DNA helicase RecQ